MKLSDFIGATIVYANGANNTIGIWNKEMGVIGFFGDVEFDVEELGTIETKAKSKLEAEKEAAEFANRTDESKDVTLHENDSQQVWTTNPGSTNGYYLMPDVEIKEDKPEYVYRPMRGHSASLLVLDNDNPIGWIDTRTLGFETAREWSKATNYVVPE